MRKIERCNDIYHVKFNNHETKKDEIYIRVPFFSIYTDWPYYINNHMSSIIVYKEPSDELYYIKQTKLIRDHLEKENTEEILWRPHFWGLKNNIHISSSDGDGTSGTGILYMFSNNQLINIIHVERLSIHGIFVSDSTYYQINNILKENKQLYIVWKWITGEKYDLTKVFYGLYDNDSKTDRTNDLGNVQRELLILKENYEKIILNKPTIFNTRGIDQNKFNLMRVYNNICRIKYLENELESLNFAFNLDNSHYETILLIKQLPPEDIGEQKLNQEDEDYFNTMIQCQQNIKLIEDEIARIKAENTQLFGIQTGGNNSYLINKQKYKNLKKYK